MGNAKNKTGAYVYDEDNNPILGLYVFSVEEEAPARIIGAPVESGQVAFDNKVVDPPTVIVKGTVVIGYDANSILAKIQSMIDNRDFKFYQVCDGAKWYDTLILENKKLSRNVGKYDFVEVTLRYKKALLVQVYSATPKNSENTDTRKNGYQQGNQISDDALNGWSLLQYTR